MRTKLTGEERKKRKAEYMRKYYEENCEKLLEYQRKYRQRLREEKAFAVTMQMMAAIAQIETIGINK